MEREGVDRAGHHSHVVCARAVKALRGCIHSADHVAPADHDSDLRPELVDLADLRCDLSQDARADAEAIVAGKALAGEFENDPPEGRLHEGLASPSLKRTKPVTSTGAPSFWLASRSSWPTV